MKPTLLQEVLQDPFVKRCLRYMGLFVLLGIIFTRLFLTNLDLSMVLGSIFHTLP